MTPPHMIGSQPSRPPSLLFRLRMTEPVRLYCYTVLLGLVVGLVLAGSVTGQWSEYGTALAAVLLGIPYGTEAARASVYSPAGAVQLVEDVSTSVKDGGRA